jgi:hypothetical protein
MQKRKEKKGHACTNQKKRYAGRSNYYNPQLHESGGTVISQHNLVYLLIGFVDIFVLHPVLYWIPCCKKYAHQDIRKLNVNL